MMRCSAWPSGSCSAAFPLRRVRLRNRNMQFSNSFEVLLPPDEAWKTLMDIPRIAPCMPGAELTGVLDKDTYNGKVSVRLGPVALTFAGQVKFTDIDEAG